MPSLEALSLAMILRILQLSIKLVILLKTALISKSKTSIEMAGRIESKILEELQIIQSQIIIATQMLSNAKMVSFCIELH